MEKCPHGKLEWCDECSQEMIPPKAQARIKELEGLVREIGKVNWMGTFRSYYTQVQKILSRPKVRAIMEK